MAIDILPGFNVDWMSGGHNKPPERQIAGTVLTFCLAETPQPRREGLGGGRLAKLRNV